MGEGGATTRAIRGATRKADVTVEMRRALEAGAPSRTHIEQMSFDMGRLLAARLPELGDRAGEFDGRSFLDRMRFGAQIVWGHFGRDVFSICRSWGSDTMRGWAAFSVAFAAEDFSDMVDLVGSFAADEHFAVREWAWLGTRPLVSADVSGAVSALEPFTAHESARMRRYACEATRPRGVWSAHLPELKFNPSAGLPLLEPLVTDTDRYVQDSVGNWLNDAAVTRPEWVRENVRRWRDGHGTAVNYVSKRALRSVRL